MSRVNIVKRIKIGGRWKMFSIPRNAKGNYHWNAIADGRYYVEWSALVVARALASAPLDTLLMLQYSLCAGPFSSGRRLLRSRMRRDVLAVAFRLAKIEGEVIRSPDLPR